MIVAFYDESGNDGRSIVFAMAGVLMCHASSYYFGNDWLLLLQRFGVGQYKASDFHRRRGEFSGWNDSRCAEFQTAVIQLLMGWEVKHTGVAIGKDDYVRSFVDTGFHRRLRPAIKKWEKPYLHAFSHVVEELRFYADHQAQGCHITAIFDRCQEFMGQAQQDYAERNHDGKLGRMIVSNTKQYVQLQASDFLVPEYRVARERQLRTGDHDPGPVMQALMPNMFRAKVWQFDCLEGFRKGVEAGIEGSDPVSSR